MSIEEKISAYLDGELSQAEQAEVKDLLQSDSYAQQVLKDMLAANAHILDSFSDDLKSPVPLALAQAIMDAPEPVAPVAEPSAPRRDRSVPRSIAAGLALFLAAAAGFGGYMLGVNQLDEPSAGAALKNRDWLSDIADYHRVYAAEKRHLAEVDPSETDHIQKWLGARTGTAFEVPGLGSRGLTFQGARLLVASGRPVAQLLYRDERGAVIALCFTATEAPANGNATLEFVASTIGDIDMVSWKKSGSSFVVVGPAGDPKLKSIAKDISQAI